MLLVCHDKRAKLASTISNIKEDCDALGVGGDMGAELGGKLDAVTSQIESMQVCACWSRAFSTARTPVHKRPVPT